MKVLVADIAAHADMALIFDVAHRLRHDAEIEVHFSKCGDDAIECARWFRPTVILLVHRPNGKADLDVISRLHLLRPGVLLIYMDGRQIYLHDSSVRHATALAAVAAADAVDVATTLKRIAIDAAATEG